MKHIEPLMITASTVVNACGVGRDATLQALLKEQGGLQQCGYPNLDFDTWLGKVDGVENHQIEDRLRNFTCRNNKLASLTLNQDNFRESVNAAVERYGQSRLGVFVGTSTSGIEETEKAYLESPDINDALSENFDYLSTHNISSLLNYVQKSLGLTGVGQSISTACSSSAKVFASAHRHITSGLCDAAIVGGVDSLCLTTLYGFNSLQLISDEICCPFDARRKGINIGEAGGFVLLERANNTHPVLKLKGYGESSDAYHMSSPHPEGEGAVLAMQAALNSAGITAEDVDYINLHGTATQSNDAAEGIGITKLFDKDVACSSTKGYTGHTLGAAGITEAVISILALEQGIIPGNLNLENKDTGIDINLIKNTKKCRINNVMTNSFGFGGSNCSLIIGW